MATFILLDRLLHNLNKLKYHKTLVAIIAVLALFLPQVSQLLILQAHAGTMTPAKVSIGDSRAGVAANHTFQFVTPSTGSIKTITFQYCTTPSGSCTAPSGMILSASPTLGTVAGIAGSTYTPTSSSGTCTGTGNTNCTLTLTVTTPAAQSAGATVIVPFLTGITNPTTINTTYYVVITTKDSTPSTIDGPTPVAFAILDTTSVAVTANVDASFAFSIAGIAGTGSNTVNGANLTNGVTTTANSIPFGTMAVGSSKVAAQDLTVSTNAQNGYNITASHSAQVLAGPLISGANKIDAFTGTNTSPTTWSAPTSTTANSNTGFFGYTTESTTLCTGTASRFSTNKWAGTTTTGAEVACSTTPVNTATTRVGYQLQIDAYQPSGSYAGTVILVATPTY